MRNNLADRFEAIVDEFGGRLCVVAPGANLTFAQLDACANRFAHWLRTLDVGPGERVGLALYNRPEHLVALLGALKVRAVPINVNYRYTAAELRAVLCDASVRAVVYEPTVSAAVGAASVGKPWTLLEMGAPFRAAMADQPDCRPHIVRSGDDRYILYTGGTTGQPKGVVWRHEDLIAGALSSLETITQGLRMLPACPLIHGTAQWTTLATLLGGATVVLGSPQGFDAAEVWSLIEREAVTRLTIVGDAFARPLLSALDAEPDRWDLSSLLVISSGGARWSPTVRDGLLEYLPHTAMVNAYGATESGGHGVDVTFAGQSSDPASGLLRFPIDETSSVFGPDNLPVTPGCGVIGRIARRGAVPLGYLNDDALSHETFPTINGVRWAIPGDLATLEADGTVVVLGRDRNVINTGGEKVFAENVEQVLVSHAAVADAVVAGMNDARWGERVEALVAFKTGESATIDELIAHCRSGLAGYKVPRRITICPEIQRKHTGKLDRTWAAATMRSSQM